MKTKKNKKKTNSQKKVKTHTRSRTLLVVMFEFLYACIVVRFRWFCCRDLGNQPGSKLFRKGKKKLKRGLPCQSSAPPWMAFSRFEFNWPCEAVLLWRSLFSAPNLHDWDSPLSPPSALFSSDLYRKITVVHTVLLWCFISTHLKFILY